GRYENKTEREISARNAGKLLVLGPRCRARGHRLRTRAGHCFQCDPKKLAFLIRHNAAGYVYIAGSLDGRLIKLGVSKDLPQRETRLRGEPHARFSDWRLLFSIRVPEMGRVEDRIALRLAHKRLPTMYFKDGNAQMATEVFKCSFSDALKAITETVG